MNGRNLDRRLAQLEGPATDKPVLVWAEGDETNDDAIRRVFGSNGLPAGVRVSVVAALSEEAWIRRYGSGQPVHETEEDLSRVTVYAGLQ